MVFLDQLDPEPAVAPTQGDQDLPAATASQQLPTMADLTALEEELNVIDATLAELQD